MPGRSFAPDASFGLISVRGTGRTTLGLLAASSLGFRLLDTDTIFQETVGLSRRAYASKHGHSNCRAQELKLLRDVLAQNPTRSDIVCGPIYVDQSGQALLRKFAEDHPVIYILRDSEGIANHLKCPSTTVSGIVKAGNPTFRSLPNFEFFNLGGSPPDARHDSREPCLSSQIPTLALKEVQKDFLHLVYSIQGRAAACSAQARTTTSLAALEQKLYTYALQLPLNEAPMLRISPVGLGLDNTLIEDIIAAKAHTKIIGHYNDDDVDSGGWKAEHRTSPIMRAQHLGCDLVRITQPAMSEADNLEAQQFLETVRESTDIRTPVIAYKTGRLGRKSRVLDPILSPVVSTLCTSSASSQQLDEEGVLTVQEAQNAL